MAAAFQADAFQSDAFEVAAGGTPFTAEPGAGAIAIAGLAPAVAANANVAPGVGAVTIAGLAPGVTAAATLSPGIGTVTIDGLAPVVVVPFTAAAGAGAVTIAGLAPVVSIGGGLTLQPGVGAVAVAGLVPNVSASAAVSPSVGAIAVAGLAPAVTADAPAPVVGRPKVIGTLRVMPGMVAFGTPGRFSRSGLPQFIVSAGDVAPLTVDWSGIAGTATLTGATWSATGVGLGATSISGRQAIATLTAANGTATCAATFSDGRQMSVQVAVGV